MKRRRPQALFVPPGCLTGTFFRVEGPVPLAVIKRLQAAFPRKWKLRGLLFERRPEKESPHFISCGAGHYIALSHEDIFPTVRLIDPPPDL